jgi:dihydrofolate synthase/folylpolyglutamate synthase
MGDPQLGLPGVLIGGTNGKGSTQAMVASVLREAGLRVGQTPKPHLVSYRERIVVDGSPIAVDDFVAVVTGVLDAAELVARKHGPPTEFEIITAAAFAWFARVGVQVGVIEVGLGGRLDATNTWQGGVSAITNVALDHMEHLGDTVEAIAREKAAIIKRGDSFAVTGASEPALKVIRGRARRVGVALDIRSPEDFDHRLKVGLLGRHQVANAAVAVGIVSALDAAGIAQTSRGALERGLAKVRWPGRLELIQGTNGQPDILFDGAHNPAGIAALADALIDLGLTDPPPVLLMGVLANHYQTGMLDPLKRALPDTLLIATSVPGAPNSMAAADLARAWGRESHVEVNPDDAFRYGSQQGRSPQRLLITSGSLYLVGYLRNKVA